MYVKIHAKLKANMKQLKFESGEISIIDGVRNVKFYLLNAVIKHVFVVAENFSLKLVQLWRFKKKRPREIILNKRIGEIKTTIRLTKSNFV
jgi:hypothetical protein